MRRTENGLIYLSVFNSLTDKEMVKLLYKASQAGVERYAIIGRGACLQPQMI